MTEIVQAGPKDVLPSPCECGGTLEFVGFCSKAAFVEVVEGRCLSCHKTFFFKKQQSATK